MNALINKKTTFIDLGLKDYKETWDYQVNLFDSILEVKAANRSLPPTGQKPTDNYLIFVQHPHVYTLGKSGNEKNLLINKEHLSGIEASYYHINRGGDITYHGPGQLVGYPILDLENFFTDIHRYMRLLEESIILTLREMGIESGRIKGLTGVWVDYENPLNARKICAFGVKMSRWVTQHGFALNVNTDLNFFENIIPCGIDNKSVTSIARELGATQDMTLVSARLKHNLAQIFEMELV